MNNDLFVVGNDLIKSQYHLTANEMRLVMLAVAKLPKQEQIPLRTPIYVTRDDFAEMGVTRKNINREIRKTCRTLRQKIVIIKTPLGDLETSWIHNALHFKSDVIEQLKKDNPNYEDDKEFINTLRLYNLTDALPMIRNDDEDYIARIVLHDDIMPYVSELRKNFTQLNLMDVTGFNSYYSFRIYLLIMQFKSTGFCKVSLGY